MLSSLVLSLLFASTSNYYHSTTGQVELVPAEDVVVLRAANNDAFPELETMMQDVSAQRVLRTDFIVERSKILSPVWISDRLQKQGMKQLKAYRRLGFDDLYISDGKINAGFHPNRSLAWVQNAVLSAGGVSVKQTHARLGWYTIEAATPEAVFDVANRLVESGDARFAHPDFFYKKTRMFNPNDELDGYQWHLDQIDMSAAWNTARGNSGIRIAIIDSGVDMDHPDLDGKLVEPYDALDQDYNPNPNSNDAHGTACAGLAAAETNNGEGVAGICPECSIIPIRIMGEQGWGRYGADVDAFVWAVDKGAHILSNSWGAGQAAEVQPNMEEAIQYAAQNGRGGLGSIVMFASGNEYRENYSFELASHPLVLGVGATGSNGAKEDYSNYGWELDFVSPAGSVTTDIRGYNGYANGDYSYSFGGTSAACPVAAGVAGLVLGVNPGLSRAEVFQILNDSADKVGNVQYQNGFSPYYGHGRINASTAVDLAAGTEPCVPSPEDCENNVDDDCDGAVDDNDSDCAPNAGQVGAPCILDSECPSGGFCITESQYDYPGGYCSNYCNNSCPSGDVCVGVGNNNSICYDGCSQTSDCRDGYDCLVLEAGQRGCIPSCTVSGCEDGYICDEVSGDCINGSAQPAGGPCGSNSDCADGNFCFDEPSYGVHQGFCGDICDNSACGTGDTCVDMGSTNLCLDDCQYNADCRDGYACYPIGEQAGVCWQSCEYAGCPDGEVCNEYGLCGESAPPIVGEPPVDENETSPEQNPGQDEPGGDNETGFDDDPMQPDGQGDVPAGDGSPEAGGVVPEAGNGDADGISAEGCASTGSSNWLVFVLLGFLVRRMARRGHGISPCA